MLQIHLTAAHKVDKSVQAKVENLFNQWQGK